MIILKATQTQDSTLSLKNTSLEKPNGGQTDCLSRFRVKPSNFVPGVIPRPEWMAVLLMFPDDIPVGPSKESLQWESNVFDMALYITLTKWHLPVPSQPERNLCTASKLCPLYFTWYLANLWTTLKTSLCFEFKEFIPSVISSFSYIFGIRLRIAEVLFISVFSELFPLGYFDPGVSSFSIWLSASWLLIKISLNFIKFRINLIN